MLLRQSAECSGERRSALRLGFGGLLLLVAALALTFPLGALAKSSPSSALGHGGTAAPAGVLGPLVPNSWAAGLVYPTTITRYAYAQSGQDLYVLGGVSNSVRTAAANRYNATTNLWASIAPVPVASEAPAAALLDGKIYLAEGDTGDSFNIYDIATNTWSAGPPRPGYADNYGAAAGAFGGKVYVVGGGPPVRRTRRRSTPSPRTAGPRALPRRCRSSSRVIRPSASTCTSSAASARRARRRTSA